MAKSIVFVPPVAALESRIACRSEPGPASAVVVTTKTPSVRRSWAWTGAAPVDWASRLSVALPWKPGGGVKRHPLQRRVRAPRADRCTTAIRSHRPSRLRPAVLESVSVPVATETVRFQTGSSGPASGSLKASPSPEADEKTSGWPGSEANGLRGCLEGGPPEGRDLGGVALRIGGRGRDDRQSAGGVNGTAKTAWPWRRSSPRSEPR